MQTLGMEWGSVSDWVNVSLTGVCVLATIWANVIANRAQRSADAAGKKHLEVKAEFQSGLSLDDNGEMKACNWQVHASVVNHGIRLYIAHVYLKCNLDHLGTGSYSCIPLFAKGHVDVTNGVYGAIEPNDQWRGMTSLYNDDGPNWDEFIRGSKVVVLTRCGYEAECSLGKTLMQRLAEPPDPELLRQAQSS